MSRTVVGAVAVLVLIVAGCGGSDGEPPEELIAYSSEYELYVMRPDGTNARPLLLPDHPEFGPEEPAWAPDGRRIAFSAGEAGLSDVWVVSVDGSGLRNITSDLTRLDDGADSDDRAPTWAPDGTKIAFSSDRCASQSCIFVVNDDGGEVKQVTRGPYDLAPSWSPDGHWIAFIRSGDLYLVSADGSLVRRITTLSSTCPGRNGDPAWSPDGRSIAYVSETPTADHKRPFCGPDPDGSADWVYWGALHVITPEGRRDRRIYPAGPLFPTRQPSVIGSPSWSPEGDQLLFEGSTPTKSSCSTLHLVDAQTGESSRLSCHKSTILSNPAWSPAVPP